MLCSVLYANTEGPKFEGRKGAVETTTTARASVRESFPTNLQGTDLGYSSGSGCRWPLEAKGNLECSLSLSVETGKN